jgi:succinoglycan biosynthesis protein ExoV
MKLFMWRGPVANFGDELNPWIWPQLIPGVLDEDDSRLFVGIGTLLTNRLPPQPKVVFGSGAGYVGMPDVRRGSWSFYCVRGPMTAAALGLPESSAVCDPGILVSRLMGDTPLSGGTRIGFMPHWMSMATGQWREACRAADIDYIDPTEPVLDVLAAVARCRLLIAEAMHGAITADAFRIPWVPIKIRRNTLPFKWQDWCRSVELDYDPIQMPASSTEETLLLQYGRLRSHFVKASRRKAGRENESGAARPKGGAEQGGGKASVAKPSVAKSFDASVRTRILPAVATAITRVANADRQFDRAVSALRDAAGRSGVLSRDSTMSARLDELEARLDRLRRDAAAGRVGQQAVA